MIVDYWLFNLEKANLNGQLLKLRKGTAGGHVGKLVKQLRVDHIELMRHFPILLLTLSLARTATASLPGDYFPLLVAGVDRVAQRLEAEPSADLATLESSAGWKHFPSMLLVSAVLYTQSHPANSRQRDAKILALA